MNILLWILQALLALHTLMGALWKFSNTVPSLQSLPQGVWIALSIVEILCAVGLILPGFIRSLGKLVPLAALVIVLEMLFLTAVVHSAGTAVMGEWMYWVVVAIFAGFIAFARLKLKPLS